MRIRRLSSMWRGLAPWLLVVMLPLSLRAQDRMERFARVHGLSTQLAGGNHALVVDFPGETVTVKGWVMTAAGRVSVPPTVLNVVLIGEGGRGKCFDVSADGETSFAPADATREDVVLKGVLHELRYYDRGGAWYLKGWFQTDTGLRVEVFPSPVGAAKPI